MDSIIKLSPDEIEKLTETFNEFITSKTSSALSTLFSEPVKHRIKILENGICDIKNVKLASDEISMCGVKLNGKGDTHIEICYTMKLKYAKKIAAKLLCQNEVTDLDEMSSSAIQEVANIMTGSFFNAMSDGTGFRVELSIPLFAQGELAPMVNVCAKDVINPVDHAVIADAELVGQQSGIKIHMIIIQDPENARKLISNNCEKSTRSYFIGGENPELDLLVQESMEGESS